MLYNDTLTFINIKRKYLKIDFKTQFKKQDK